MSANFTLNIKQLKTVVKPMIRNRKVPFVRSAPGIGKTQAFEQVAQEMGYKFLPPLYPSCLQDVEVAGLPVPVENNTKLRRLMDELMEPAFTAKEPSLLLIDEFTEGSHSVQAALAPLIRERYIGKNRLPDCVSIAVAGNERKHRTGGNLVLTHLLSRFVTIVDLIADVDCWLEWAVTTRIRPEITSFIKFQPGLLLDFKPDQDFEHGNAYPNPRSWVYVDDTLNLEGIPTDLEQTLFSGTIGEKAAGMFTAHLPIFRTNLNLLDIVTRNADFKFPKDLATRWAFCFGVPSLAGEKTIKRIFEIANKLHSTSKESEFAKIIISQAIAIYPQVCSTDLWFKFIDSPLGKLIDNSRVMV